MFWGATGLFSASPTWGLGLSRQILRQVLRVQSYLWGPQGTCVLVSETSLRRGMMPLPSLHSVPSQAQAVESSLANVCWLMKRGWRINGVNMGQKTCDARVIVLDFWIGKVSETTLPDQLRARKSPQNFILKERSLWAPLLLILFLPQTQWLLSKEPSSTHCRPLLPEEVYSPQGAVSPSTPPFQRMLLTFTNLSGELVRSWSVSMDLAFLFSSSSISVISNWEQSEHNILQYHTYLSGMPDGHFCMFSNTGSCVSEC